MRLISLVPAAALVSLAAGLLWLTRESDANRWHTLCDVLQDIHDALNAKIRYTPWPDDYQPCWVDACFSHEDATLAWIRVTTEQDLYVEIHLHGSVFGMRVYRHCRRTEHDDLVTEACIDSRSGSQVLREAVLAQLRGLNAKTQTLPEDIFNV